jgi:hypothetical protein
MKVPSLEAIMCLAGGRESADIDRGWSDAKEAHQGYLLDRMDVADNLVRRGYVTRAQADDWLEKGRVPWPE